MQLPRGTFREIRKKVILRDLLLELGQTRFTGTCGLVSGPATGSFVFREGACILAKFRGEMGESGWKEMIQSANEFVDVILATFDEAQVKLSLEFNPACRLTGKGPVMDIPVIQEGTSHAGNHQTPHPGMSSPSSKVKPSRRRTVIITGPAPTITSGNKAGEQPPPRHVNTIKDESAGIRDSVIPTAGEKEDLESDIDALDSMDLDHVASRIRSDCKILIKQLQLEHLMEPEKQ